MKKFRFSLETVLKVRRSTEEAAQRAFAAAKALRDGCFAKLAATEKAGIDLAAEQGGWRRKSRIDLFQEQAFQGRKLALHDLALSLKRELDGLDEKMEAARLALVKASQDRKVLEKLEEHQLDEHLKKLNREEQAFFDELAAHSAGPA
jgi:flagellar FliJ protein